MHQRYIALLLCTTTWITHIFVRGALPILLPLITREFSLSYTEAGILVTASLMTFALIQLPAGYLASRIGSKRTIVLGIGSLAVSSALLATSKNYVQFFIFCMLGNIGPGSHVTVATALISNFFDEREIGKAIGTHESAVSIGNLLASLAILPLALLLSWRLTYFVCATAALAVTAIVWVSFPRTERIQTGTAFTPEPKRRTVNRRLLMLFAMFTSHAFVFQSVSSFLPLFLSVEKKVLLVYLAYYVAVPHTMGILGRPLGGHLSDKVGRRAVILVSTSSLASGILLIVLMQGDYWLLLSLVLLGFGVHTSIPVMFALLTLMFPPSRRVIIVGRINAVRNVIASLSPTIVGGIIDSSGFPVAFLVLVIVALAGFFVTLRFPEKTAAKEISINL